MRVAVVATGARGRVDAEAADRLDWLATALGARGHDVTLFGPAWWGERDGVPPPVDDEADAAVDAAAGASGGLAYRPLTLDGDAPPRRLAARLPAALREVAPDVVHMAHANPLAVAAAAAAGTLLGVPLVVDWYDLRSGGGWHDAVRPLAARAPDLVVAPSRLVQTGLHELGRRRRDVRVVPTPVDFEAIRAVQPEPLADLVYSRRLDEAANLESLLLALAELRELDWDAAVVGDGPARERYEGQASDLRIDDRVHFLGDQPLERRLGLFRGAHVYVHTALEAPFAPDLLRAVACGCVGVAAYHAGSAAHELIEHRDRGIRVTSEEELVEAIRDAADLERLTVDEAYEGFDVGPVLERLLRAYRDLVAGD